nr:MAG TPA: tailspike protein [Caudoviricetes sp.]
MAIRTVNSCCGNDGALVEHFIGTAYDVVKTVYDNLGILQYIYDFLNQHGVLVTVDSVDELKALKTEMKYARVYTFSNTAGYGYTDYLYVEGDTSGVIPNDTTATGSWIVVASSSTGGSDGGNAPAYIPWVYAQGSALGGETTIAVPAGTVGVPFIIVEGYMNTVGYGYTFDTATLTVTLAQPLEVGDEVVLLLTGTPAVPDNPNISNWVTINWLYNGGYAVGGEQVIAIPYTFEAIPAIYKNGDRYYAGLADKSYTVDAANQRILLTEPLATNDRLIVQIGGESTTFIMSDRTVQEVARSANVHENEVILSTNTTQYLNDMKVVYDVVAQKIYGLPTLPANVYINSVSNGQLTYSPGNITVDLLDVPSPAQENLDSFKADLASNTGERLVGVCPTIAVLRTTEPVSNGQRITLREYASGTGKGGGQFRALLDGSTYTDNNGTTIKTTGGAVWLRIGADVLNPLMFGAIGDGSNDDSTAINNMLAVGKPSSELVGLTYGIGGTIYNQNSAKHVMRNGTLKLLPAGYTQPMMRLKNASHEVYAVNLDGGGSNTSIGFLWEGANARSGKIHDCTISYLGSQGIYVSGDYTNNLFASYGSVKNIRFIQCGNNGTANGRATMGFDGVSNFEVDGIIATNCNWGIYFRNDLNISGVARAGNNRLSNVILRGSGRTHATFTDAQGISASYQDNLQILGVTVSDFADNGIDMQYCDASIVNDWRVNNCKDGVFMGDRGCRRHVISNGVAIDVDRGIRLVTDGTYSMNSIVPSLNQIKISNVHVYNPVYVGIYLVNSGKAAYGSTMTNVQLINCSVDGTSSYSNGTQTFGFQIQGGVNISLTNCDTLNIRQHGISVKDSEFVRIMGGTHQNVDRAGAGNQGIYVDSDCNRVSISDISVYGSGTAGAVTLAGGGGHSVKHVRWRGVANGVTSSGATSPYLLDNTSF